MKAKTTAKLLALLGFSTAANSCEALSEIGGGGMVCMYGQPSASYVFNAEVVDEEGNPIEGIKASVKPTERTYLSPSDIPDAQTDKDGKAQLKLLGIWPQNEFTITMEDIDGADNGGEFESETTTVFIENNDYEGKGEWVRGTATKRVKVQLEKK